MWVDENEFFLQATKLLCGSLDIEKALKLCHRYLQHFMPVFNMHFATVESGLRNMRVVAQSTLLDNLEARGNFPLDDEARAKYQEELASGQKVLIINRPELHPIARQAVKLLGKTDVSFMIMHLEIEDMRITDLVLQAEGFDKYNKSHAHLISLLHDPFAIAISNALSYQELVRLKDIQSDQIRYLNQALLRFSGDEIIGRDFGLKEVMEKVLQVAPLNTPVLILGETGVGKEVIANAIHYSSPRNCGPFIKINCGAIPDNLVDSELFGHEKGAFTGAFKRKRGLFELANEGTIFLDEIGELPLPQQTRLLRVLENHEIKPVGGVKSKPVDIRIIVATNRDLEEMVVKNKFRKDLLYRLNVFPITIPPLRERKEDIYPLVHHFVMRKSREMNLPTIPPILPEAMERLGSYHWPGNVRELENMVERALIRHTKTRESSPLSFQDLGLLNTIKTAKNENQELFLQCEGIQFCPHIFRKNQELHNENENIQTLDDAIYDHIQRALKLTNGKITGFGGAAEILGIHPNTLRGKMDKLGIHYKRRRKTSRNAKVISS